jgi:hypothetical protein
LDWLLDSDPAIRWQLLRDLGGAPAEIVGAERDWVATEGLVASILSDIQVKVIAVRPRATWAPYFVELLVRHGAGDEGFPRNAHSGGAGSLQLSAGRCRLRQN